MLPSREMSSKRHNRHLPHNDADVPMTGTMTDDASIRHPSYLTSYQKPRNYADSDTYDASRAYVAGGRDKGLRKGQR